MVNNLHYVKELGQRSLEALESGDLDKFGRLMQTEGTGIVERYL
jgi:D-glycero-alpha-D-manno-heptose-7-phosphate kinase